jgi:hypothetical protein
MVDPKVLKHHGSDSGAIKRLFTCHPPGNDIKDPEEIQRATKLWEHRQRFEKLIASRLDRGVAHNFRNYHFYAAVDLAWDSHAITKVTVPLMQYAQGKIKFERIRDQIKDEDKSTLEKFCEFDKKGEITQIDIPKLHDTWVNITRSFVTRRTAAVSAAYVNAHPFFKFHPFSTSWVAKLRGDVLSQRIEMMVNQYGYRHEIVQIARDALLYGHTVEFPARAWDKQEQMFFRPEAEGMDDEELESRTVKEGLPMCRPHPSRMFYDNSKPLSMINTGNGPRWIGFWDVRRYGDIANNPNYFNRREVEISGNWHRIQQRNAGYFSQYFDCSISFPAPMEVDVAGENDRLQNMPGSTSSSTHGGMAGGGRYSTEREDDSVVLSEYRELVIPKDVGLGDYPHPVWMRLTVAGDRTVIAGQFLPSLPAIYYGYNENDGRQINISFAHEAMEWQDPMSNMLTQLLMTQTAGLIKIITLNTDMLDEESGPTIRKELKQLLKGNRLFERPRLIEYSASKKREFGVDPRSEEIIKLHEAKWMEEIGQFFRGIVQLLSLAERVLHFSAQEQGQASPREITAHEVMEIRDTTQTMHAFHRMGIDEGIAAKKQLLYESWIAYGDDEIEVPVTRRYSPDTIEAAGFRILEEGDEGENPDGNLQKEGQTVIGSKRALVYNYNFNSRDGGERVSNTRSAEVLVQFLAQLPSLGQVFPGLIESLSSDQIMKLIGEIFRLSGASDLQFELPDPGNGDQQGAQQTQGQMPVEQQIGDLAQRIVNTEQKTEESTGRFERQINELARVLQSQGINPISSGEQLGGSPGIPVASDPFSPMPVDSQIDRVLNQ